MLLTSGFLCSNGNSLAEGGDFGCRGFGFLRGSGANACLLENGRRFVPDIDRVETALSDAKRHRSVFDIASPDRERASGLELLHQADLDELLDSLSGRFA